MNGGQMGEEFRTEGYDSLQVIDFMSRFVPDLNAYVHSGDFIETVSEYENRYMAQLKEWLEPNELDLSDPNGLLAVATGALKLVAGIENIWQDGQITAVTIAQREYALHEYVQTESWNLLENNSGKSLEAVGGFAVSDAVLACLGSRAQLIPNAIKTGGNIEITDIRDPQLEASTMAYFLCRLWAESAGSEIPN